MQPGTSFVDVLESLLPRPKRAERTGGACPLGSDSPLEIHVADGRVEKAARGWLSSLGRSTNPGRRFVLVEDAAAISRGQGYRLEISPDGIVLTGGSAAGCFHGLQTLRQLTRDRQIPCVVIEDAPDYSVRGLLHDISRGKVPTLQTLKRLVDRLALLKVNQLQLYIEHAFCFSFDPEIGSANDGLTPDEVRDLSEYAHERFIDVVPAVATLGHMGRILGLPQYHELAEIEAPFAWPELTWPQRARGLTLNIADPKAWPLVESIWKDILAAFSSPTVNICGDEPWDMGKGRGKGCFGAGGRSGAYFAHMMKINELCARHGRRVQLWSDVLLQHKELITQLPKDVTILHWGYDQRTDYAATGTFTQAGFSTSGCPGTSGWKRIVNAIELAEQNITTFAATGRDHGATGLINTDWGDHGHFHPLACSWHGIAFGAACAWNIDQPSGSAFDDCLATTILRLGDSEPIKRLRAVALAAGSCETWRLMWLPLVEAQHDATWPTRVQALELREAAVTAHAAVRSMRPNELADHEDVEELALACRFMTLLAERVIMAHDASEGGRHAPQLPGLRPREWSRRVQDATADYARVWSTRNKPSGLADIQRALERCGAEQPFDHPGRLDHLPPVRAG